ncbi:MAG: phosphatidylinositol kinase [Gammaproteobacteria bacterium]|nr:MAG: phosphatidylinositol kinase [Gammaproteobacteria bacterium]
MRRTGKVYFQNIQAGLVWQDEDGYGFQYSQVYLLSSNPQPVSLTLPLREEPYLTKILHPFFDGLIPEGWLLDITVKNWKANPNDRMGLLLIACKDCIGAVSIEPLQTEEG